MTEAERVEQIYHNSSPDMLTPEGWQFLIKMARIGASVMPRPRLSMEMLASLEETWEAMEAVGEDPKDAAALRALLDWHYNFSTPQVKP